MVRICHKLVQPLFMIFVTPIFLAAATCIGAGAEQKGITSVADGGNASLPTASFSQGFVNLGYLFAFALKRNLKGLKLS